MVLEQQDFIAALGDSTDEPNVLPDELWALYQSALRHAELREISTHRLAEIMAKPVVTIHSDASLAEASNLILQHRISGLPVIENGELVGILTEGDLLAGVGVPAKPPRSLWYKRIFNAWNQPPRILVSPSHKVRDIMTRTVITAIPEDSLGKGLDLMRKHQVNRLVIVDDQCCVQGIVSRSDILRFTSADPSTIQPLLPVS